MFITVHFSSFPNTPCGARARVLVKPIGESSGREAFQREYREMAQMTRKILFNSRCSPFSFFSRSALIHSFPGDIDFANTVEPAHLCPGRTFALPEGLRSVPWGHRDRRTRLLGELSDPGGSRPVLSIFSLTSWTLQEPT